MTKDDVRVWLMRIQAAADKGDFEVAHVEEDRLHFNVLVAIAEGEIAEDVTLSDNDYMVAVEELAAEALKSRHIEFPRVSS